MIKVRQMVPGGFTLVELLVVIAIVGMLTSLVGPYSSKLWDSARAQQERIELERLIRRLRSDAFMKGQSIVVSGDGSKLSWTVDGALVGERRLGSSFIEPGTAIEINRNGIAVPSTLEVSQSGRGWVIEVNEGLEIKQ